MLLLKFLYFKLGKHVSLWHAIYQEVWYRVLKHDILERAYGLAFNFTLAIFPAIIFSLTLITYIPIVGLESKIVFFLKDSMPGSVYEALMPVIQDTVSKQRSGLLSLGFLSTLYLATNGIMSLLQTFHLADEHRMEEERGYLKQRAIATLLTLALIGALLSTFFLLIFARQLLDFQWIQELVNTEIRLRLMSSLKMFIIFSMFFATIAGIYYLGPAAKQHWLFVSIGAFVATILSFVASLGFSYYVNNFAHYNRIYGSLGVMIVLMMALFLISLTLLIGFELNVSILQVLQRSKQSSNSSAL